MTTGSLGAPPLRLAQGDWWLATALVLSLVGAADTVWSIHDRFGPDLAELAPAERAGVALWDFRPLVLLPGALAAVMLAVRLPSLPARRFWGQSLAVVAGAYTTLCGVVLAMVIWIAAAGGLGASSGVRFAYSPGERATTLATQLIAYVPLGVLFAAVAAVAARRGPEARTSEPSGVATPEAIVPGTTSRQTGTRLLGEMEELWRQRLAFTRDREHARRLLERLREADRGGDAALARRLAEELRRL